MVALDRRGRVAVSLLVAASALLAVLFFAGAGEAQSTEVGAPRTSGTQVGPGSGQESELEGELEVLIEDHRDFSRTLFFLKTPERRLPLRFDSKPPTNLLTGVHVRVRGAQQPDGSLMLASGSTSVRATSTTTASTAPLPNTFGAQSTLIILVNFQDNPGNQPYTVADAQSVVFGTASDFFLENSYQQTWLSGEVVGWYTIPLSSTTCDTSSIASYAQSAASAAGVNLSAYNHYVYAFPQDNACGWGGLSYIGGSPSQSWINGSLQVHVVAHELGHALGLYHSHLLNCGTAATIGSDCTIIEYGDILDVMGAPQTPAPHYNAFQKEQLGWLNYAASPSITTVQTPGTYTLDAYELAGSGSNALKIPKSTDPTTGAKTWYYVEARRAVGFDGFMTNQSSQNETNGVLVHIGTEGNANTSDLLDMTPATPTYYWWFDPSLVLGPSFEDSTAGVILTTSWVTSTAAAVDVEFIGAVTVATNQQSYSLGRTVSITATAMFGSSPVANAVLSFTMTKANGSMVTATEKTALNGTAVYKLKLKNTDPAGTYKVSVSATINGTSTSAATTFAVL